MGYGLAPVVPAADSWTADTWQTGALIGEIESLGALPGNTAAIRLYQRHGFHPTWSYLSRFAGR